MTCIAIMMELGLFCYRLFLFVTVKDIPCDAGWSYNPVSHSCVMLVEEVLNQVNALSNCQSMSARLLQVRNSEISSWIGQYLNSKGLLHHTSVYYNFKPYCFPNI